MNRKGFEVEMTEIEILALAMRFQKPADREAHLLRECGIDTARLAWIRRVLLRTDTLIVDPAGMNDTELRLQIHDDSPRMKIGGIRHGVLANLSMMFKGCPPETVTGKSR